MKRLMVYGTLMEKQGNHHLLKNSTLIGKSITNYRNYNGAHLLTPVTTPINEHLCEVEIYDVPKEDYEIIKKFEERCGYKEVVFKHNEDVIIFIPQICMKNERRKSKEELRS